LGSGWCRGTGEGDVVAEVVDVAELAEEAVAVEEAIAVEEAVAVAEFDDTDATTAHE
jgi:hypothetical protein